MFCSENCKNEAYTNFHRFECIVMKQLLKSGSVHMALRLFFTAFSIMKDSIIDLQKFVEENINSNFTIFDVQKEDKEKGKLKALISLVASAKVFDLTQHLEILQCHPIFEEILRDNKQFIEKFLLRMCQISDLNFHGIFSGDGSTSQSVSENPTEAFKNLQKSIGSGAYLFNSLLNHSCANNIIRICSDRKIITVVCQPIPKGSQIFDCYK
jgi:SET and MYND domain-containing protein 4